MLSCWDIYAKWSHTRYQNLGSLGKKQECWNWACLANAGQSDFSMYFCKRFHEINDTYVIASVLLPIFSYTAFTAGPLPYIGYRGCFVEKASRILWANYVVLTIVETGTNFYATSFFERTDLKQPCLLWWWLVRFEHVCRHLRLTHYVSYCSLNLFRSVWPAQQIVRCNSQGWWVDALR